LVAATEGRLFDAGLLASSWSGEARAAWQASLAGPAGSGSLAGVAQHLAALGQAVAFDPERRFVRDAFMWHVGERR